MFHQVEGIYVDRDVSFGNLKDLINRILFNLFGKKVEIDPMGNGNWKFKSDCYNILIKDLAI